VTAAGESDLRPDGERPSAELSDTGLPSAEPTATERSDTELWDLESAGAGPDLGPADTEPVSPNSPSDPDPSAGATEPEVPERPDKVGDMARLEIRGPFLLLFALAQQQSSLLHHAMADRPLQPAEFAVYSALRLSQPTTPPQLTASLAMKATTMSSMLARMAKTGHL